MNITINVSAEEIEKLSALVENPSDATTEVEDAVLGRIVAQAALGALDASNDMLTIRRPRWAGGGDPVTAEQIRKGLVWLAKQDVPNGLTNIPVFATLHLVMDALKEVEEQSPDQSPDQGDYTGRYGD